MDWDGIQLALGSGLPWVGNLHCGLTGRHQASNAALAVASLGELASRRWRIEEAGARESFRGVFWPGRLHRVEGDPPLLLDGAHNAPAARVLQAALRELAPDRDVVLVLGILQDKDHAEICRELAPMARNVVVTRVRSHRTTEQDQLAEECRRAAPNVPVDAAETVDEALDVARHRSAALPQPLVCVAGSLFLVGEVCSLLGIDTIDLP
jgi:dihydrofolate synthase/folylpolyglutamate synthase